MSVREQKKIRTQQLNILKKMLKRPYIAKSFRDQLILKALQENIDSINNYIEMLNKIESERGILYTQYNKLLTENNFSKSIIKNSLARFKKLTNDQIKNEIVKLTKSLNELVKEQSNIKVLEKQKKDPARKELLQVFKKVLIQRNLKASEIKDALKSMDNKTNIFIKNEIVKVRKRIKEEREQIKQAKERGKESSAEQERRLLTELKEARKAKLKKTSERIRDEIADIKKRNK